MPRVVLEGSSISLVVFGLDNGCHVCLNKVVGACIVGKGTDVGSDPLWTRAHWTLLACAFSTVC